MGSARDGATALLSQVPVFETLASDDLARVAEVSVPRRFSAHHIIFREGDASDTCYVVRSGHARAIREHADGRTIALAHFGPGDIFGELAMFDDERRSATVETLDDVEAIAILGADMRRLLRGRSVQREPCRRSYSPVLRSYTETCSRLSAVNGPRRQSPQRSRSRRPASRAIRSSSAGQA